MLKTIIYSPAQPVPEDLVIALAHAILDRTSVKKAEIEPVERKQIFLSCLFNENEQTVLDAVAKILQELINEKNKKESSDVEIFFTIQGNICNQLDISPQLIEKGWLIPFKHGEFGYDQRLIRLMQYFDRTLTELFSTQFKFIQREYSSTLPVAFLKQMNYKEERLASFWFMKNQGDDSAHPPALQTAPCFKIYFELENKVLDKDLAYTLVGHCFRHERGRTFLFETLTQFRMREFVFVGSKQHVLDSKRKCDELSVRWLRQMGLDGIYCAARDPFFIDNDKRREFDIPKNVKSEIRCDIPGRQRDISIGSFDVHGEFFSAHLNITSVHGGSVWSGCLGFGIERCVWAFLQQKGLAVENWPEPVKKAVADEVQVY